jgi:putative transposase
MREYLHRGHTVTDIKQHFVWTTKYRYPVLADKKIGERLRQIVREVCIMRGIAIISGVVSKDHVHVFLQCPAHLAPADVAKWIKGKSSRKLQMEFPELRRRYWGQHLWSRGYFCASAGTVTDEMIKEYIKAHGEKDDESNFRLEVPE